MVISSFAKKLYSAIGLIALVILSVFTGVNAANAQSDKTTDGPTLIDDRCRSVVVVGDRDADVARDKGMEDALLAGGIENVDIIGGQGFNSRKLADYEDVDTGESCVISMLGRTEMLKIGDSEKRGQVVVDRVEDKFPDSKIFWSMPTVKSTTNTKGLFDAIRSSGIDIINFPAVADKSDVSNGKLTEEGEQKFSDFVADAFFQLASVEREEGKSPDSKSDSSNGGSSDSGNNNSGSNSGNNNSGSNSPGSGDNTVDIGGSNYDVGDGSIGNNAARNNSAVVPGNSFSPSGGGSTDGGNGSGSSNWNPNASSNPTDSSGDQPYTKGKVIELDTDKFSPKAELARVKDNPNASWVMENYSMLGRWGGNLELPSSNLQMTNPIGSMKSVISNWFGSGALIAGGFFTSLIVVYLFPRAFSLDIMSSAMNSVNNAFSSLGSSLFRFQDNASDNELAHTGGIMGAILVLIIIFSAWNVLRSPWGSLSQLLPSVAKASVGAIISMALFVGMVYQSSKPGPGNGDGQAGNPMSWPALSPAWFISWGVGTANIVISTGTNVVMSALSQFGDNGTPNNPEEAPSSCDRFQDSMYDIAFSSPAMDQTSGTNSTLLLKMDDLLGSPIMHLYGAMYGGNTLSSANTWCLSLETARANDSSNDGAPTAGQFALIARGANYNVDAFGGGSLASGGYASGNIDFGTARTIPGGPERGGRYVEADGSWARAQGGTDSEGREYEYQDYGYQGTVNILGGINPTAKMESTIFHAMCFWDPKTGNPVFNQEWNNVQYMNPRVEGETATGAEGEEGEEGEEQTSPTDSPNGASRSGDKESTGANAQSDKCFNVTAPTHGTKTSGVGPRWGTTHKGLDISNSLGTEIVSATDGEVISSGPADGYGNWIRVKAPDGKIHIYGHMTADSLVVSEGDSVKAGERIASIGNEGFSTGPHLHWQIEEGDGSIVDPEDWMRDVGISSSNDAMPASSFKELKKSCDGSDAGRAPDSDGSGSGSGSGSDGSGGTENGETESPSGDENPDGTRNYTSGDKIKDVFSNKRICTMAPSRIYYDANKVGRDYGFGGPESTLSSKLNYTPRVKTGKDVAHEMASNLPGAKAAGKIVEWGTNAYGKAKAKVTGEEHVDVEDRPRADNPAEKFEGADKAYEFWSTFTGGESRTWTAAGAIIMGSIAGIIAVAIFGTLGLLVLVISMLFTALAMFAGLLAFGLILSLIRRIGKGSKGGK